MPLRATPFAAIIDYTCRRYAFAILLYAAADAIRCSVHTGDFSRRAYNACCIVTISQAHTPRKISRLRCQAQCLPFTPLIFITMIRFSSLRLRASYAMLMLLPLRFAAYFRHFFAAIYAIDCLMASAAMLLLPFAAMMAISCRRFRCFAIAMAVTPCCSPP